MSFSSNDLFSEFLEDYYAESDEHLASTRQNLLSLENCESFAACESLIDELLRSLHSLKGLSSMVGVKQVPEMAHLMEEYLREIRAIGSVPSPAGLDALMTGVDAMEQINNARRKGQAFPDVGPAMATLQSLTSKDRLDSLPGLGAPDPVSVKTWKFTFSPTQDLTDRGINVNVVREKLSEIGSVVRGTPRVPVGGGLVFDFVVTSDLAAAGIEPLMLPGMTFAAAEEPTAESPERESPQASPSGTSFVRVEMQKLDELMRLIGELVIGRAHLDERFKSVESQLSSSDFRELTEVNARMERQLRGLREAVMRVRMVPIRHVFERMRFVVRGLERDTNKRVRLETRGHETEIDKLIVDRMMDPLLHMVRNSVSHGIESPSERLAAGKPEEGLISISARTAGEKVIIEVEDDGRGVQAERVMEKVRGSRALGRDTSDSASLLDIICKPGFSTREDADLTSGRGVGMSVVVSTIQGLGGHLSMDTEAGRGTRFTITLPLTLVILDALLVTVGSQRFAVPQSGIREIVAADKSEIKKIENNKLIPYRGGVLPLIEVSDLFRFTPGTGKRVHVLVIGDGSKSVGLGVDKVTGHREIVVRSISDSKLHVPGVVGATELGDGKPILIVDAEALVRFGGLGKEVRA